MLPASVTRQHAPTPPQPSPLRQGLCAWEQRSSTWRHRSGLGAPNWTLTQPPGSKSGAWGKYWVQHQETQNSCPLSMQTRTVPGRWLKSALTSRRKPGYWSIPIRDCQKQVQQSHHHHQSLNRKGRWGTTDDFATSFLHFSLFSTALWDLSLIHISEPTRLL